MSMLKKFLIPFLSICTILCVCCCQSVSAKSKVRNAKVAAVTSEREVPFQEAENYFIKNNIKKIVSPIIRSQKVFEKIFGEAPVMGKNGEPTKINFKKQFVLVADKPETSYSTEMKCVSLKKNKVGNLVFTYEIKIGEKQTYTIRPFLLIVVDKKYMGKPILKEVRVQ